MLEPAADQPESLLERELDNLRNEHGRDGATWEGWVHGRPGEGGKPIRQGYVLAGDGVEPVEYFKDGEAAVDPA